jgi:hypothetical protein
MGMANLSGHIRRILRLLPGIERAANSSVANTAAHIEQTGKGAKTEEQPGDDGRSLLETLPAIDSIDATTDIRAFLKPGVPAGLKHAALRRAWATDPAIRDFVGIAENQWDFNDPQSIPGFGLLNPLQNIQRLMPTLSVGRSTESQNIREQQPESQKTLDNVVRVAEPGIETHPARADDSQTNAVAKPEGSKQTDV